MCHLQWPRRSHGFNGWISSKQNKAIVGDGAKNDKPRDGTRFQILSRSRNFSPKELNEAKASARRFH